MDPPLVVFLVGADDIALKEACPTKLRQGFQNANVNWKGITESLTDICVVFEQCPSAVLKTLYTLVAVTRIATMALVFRLEPCASCSVSGCF